ncbi:MAG: glycosyl hydrolase [Bacteroidota bacterium]
MRKTTLLALSVIFAVSCDSPPNQVDSLYEGFKNPPSQARPFVRWWWNGNKITSEEIKRELQVMHEAGIGGVEINPIAIPDEAPETDIESLEWLSKEWNELLVLAGMEAQSRGMVTDLIVGSGWPFGGEFLTQDQMLQRIVTGKKIISGPATIDENLESLERDYLKDHPRRYDENPQEVNLLFAYLVPTNASGLTEIKEIEIDNGVLAAKVPAGNYELIYGLKEVGHRDVMFGSPGAKGPVMDHYDREVLLQYLSRLKKIEKDTGVPLNEIIRALFCDSIELAGANWTDDFASMFEAKYGYDLTPYFPFVFYPSNQGYSENGYSDQFNDTLKRVRYDYNEFLVDTFLENFTRTFKEFSNENGMLSRYQAYGVPFLMGMLEGNMITDIPESNNWIFSAPLDTPAWVWNQGHGYMIWNMYAAAGGHLTGKKIISNEAMTNTKGVFQLTLEDIKQADDMNFITGMNHSVLHGYNYSPPEAGFPGWVRFGAYFSDQNTWWPYFKNWADYTARLSYIFQNSQPIKKVAILGPQTDLWGDVGLVRAPFHITPWYLYRLWEPISQLGSSCEYINERIIREGSKSKGTLSFGPMDYEALIIAGVTSINPETVFALMDYVEKGGKLIFIGSIPSRTASMKDMDKDQEVVDIVDLLFKEYPKQVIYLDPPVDESNLLEWSKRLWNEHDLPKDLEIMNPDPDVYQIHQSLGDKEIYFLTNTHREWASSSLVRFPFKDKNVWIWDPHTGDKIIYPTKVAGQLHVALNPMESILLICSEEAGEPEIEEGSKQPIATPQTISGDWKVTFNPAFGESFTEIMSFIDFTESSNKAIRTFAGEAIYETTFTPDESYDYITLGNVNRGVTQVTINGELLGTRWYGQHRYDVNNVLKVGKENTIQIKLVTTLANYAKSLSDNPVAKRWTNSFTKKSEGLEGPVVLR